MKTLRSVRIKPNPSGKDRTRRGGATAKQLGGEWVDIENSGRLAVDLNGVTLYHIAYSGHTDNGRWDKVMSFRGTLGAGEIIRVHAGSGPLTALNAIDQQGATYHLFTGHDAYVWNNDRGDCPALWQSGERVPFDMACYGANPPEGAILARVGDRLVASSAALAAARR